MHGTGALFSAAYGNVGSSIYYALGVTAAFALGLTPIAFVIAGLIFVFTAASYTEATVMYPEAGGSSSFARHAFNELASFFAAWAQMLNYVITVAISAFFVPHYLSVFWAPLKHGPGDVIGGVILVALLAALNIKGTKESSRLNLVLAIGDLCTQIVLVGIGVALVLSPDILVNNVHLGTAPTWGNFALGIAVGMIAYTGIETISNMAEEARDAPRMIPRGVGFVVLAVIGLYVLIPIVALSAMPVTQDAAGHYTTALGTQLAIRDWSSKCWENMAMANCSWSRASGLGSRSPSSRPFPATTSTAPSRRGDHAMIARSPGRRPQARPAHRPRIEGQGRKPRPRRRPASAPPPGSAAADAVSALLNLGFRPAGEAAAAVGKAEARARPGGDPRRPRPHRAQEGGADCRPSDRLFPQDGEERSAFHPLGSRPSAGMTKVWQPSNLTMSKSPTDTRTPADPYLVGKILHVKNKKGTDLSQRLRLSPPGLAEQPHEIAAEQFVDPRRAPAARLRGRRRGWRSGRRRYSPRPY